MCCMWYIVFYISRCGDSCYEWLYTAAPVLYIVHCSCFTFHSRHSGTRIPLFVHSLLVINKFSHVFCCMMGFAQPKLEYFLVN